MLLASQFSDPLKAKDLFKKYGITRILKHKVKGGAVHFHIEFNPYQ